MVGLKWTDAEAEASAQRAATALTAIANCLARRCEPWRDAAMAAEVRRRDAQQWARPRARGRG